MRSEKMFFWKMKRREKQMSSHIEKPFVRQKKVWKKNKEEKVQRNDEGNNNRYDK